MKKISSENIANATLDTWILKLNHNISLPDIVKIFPFTHKAKIITKMDGSLPSLKIRINKFLLGQVHNNSYNYNLSSEKLRELIYNKIRYRRLSEKDHIKRLKTEYTTTKAKQKTNMQIIK